MTEIYLHKSDLEDILKFINDMNVGIVQVSHDNSSGIGAISPNMGPRYDAVCLTCYDKEPELRSE